MPLKLFIFIFFNNKTNTLRPLMVMMFMIVISSILFLFVLETTLLVLSAKEVHIPLKILDVFINYGEKIFTK